MRRRGRSAADATTLNTAQVYARYGLDRGKLYYECQRFRESKGREGLAHIQIKGRGGKKGTLLFRVEAIEDLLRRGETTFETNDKETTK